ncbi:hypothetical protein BH23VER1_BH23VER1_13160 [soil metagenome]
MRTLASLALAIVISATAAVAADQEPTYKNVDAAAAAKLVAEDTEKKVQILDLRTPAEFAESHLKGAKNIDFLGEDFAEKVGALDRDKTYLIHCASGRRSTPAFEKMRELGFESVIHLDGGMAAWKEAGNPVVEE